MNIKPCTLMKPVTEETHVELPPVFNGMNKGQKLLAAKNIITALGKLADAAEADGRHDIANAIRSVMTGRQCKVNRFTERFTYGIWNQHIVTVDNQTGNMNRCDKKTLTMTTDLKMELV